MGLGVLAGERFDIESAGDRRLDAAPPTTVGVEGRDKAPLGEEFDGFLVATRGLGELRSHFEGDSATGDWRADDCLEFARFEAGAIIEHCQALQICQFVTYCLESTPAQP